MIVDAQVVLAPNDKQQIEPMLERLEALPEALGKPETMLVDTGYFSEANVELCAAAQIEPMIALGRQPHYPSLSERFAKAAPAPQNLTPLEAKRHGLQTPAGRRFYALRKQIPEPVFGIIKSVMGFRQLLLRGRVQGEWSLVTMAWNTRRMYALTAA
jgi:Transposase DDE domain